MTMELLESDDPKSKLLKKSVLQRQALQEETKLISARTEKVIVNALIIGGALAATFFLIRQFSGKSSSGKKVKAKKLKLVSSTDDDAEVVTGENTTGIVTQIGTALASQATVFLLNLAKEKLSEYLQHSSPKESHDK